MSAPLVLTRRTRLTAELVTRAGLHPGAGDGPLGRSVLRDIDGRPYVPGSALRGVLRHGLDALLRGLDEPGKGL